MTCGKSQVQTLYCPPLGNSRQGSQIWSRLLAVAVIATLVALFVLTAVFGNVAILLIGMQVIMGGAFLVSIIVLVRMFTHALRDVKDETATKADVAQTYEQEIADVNHTGGYDNRMAMANHELKSWLRLVRASPKGDIVKSIILLVWLFGTLFGGIALLVRSNSGENLPLMIAGICVTACFPLTIVIAGITVAVRQRLSRKADHNQPPMAATVVSCTISSQASTGSHVRRIGTTNYKVVVTVSGGEQLVAYTRRAYNAGDQITVQPSRTKGLVTVLDAVQ